MEDSKLEKWGEKWYIENDGQQDIVPCHSHLIYLLSAMHMHMHLGALTCIVHGPQILVPTNFSL